MNGKDAARFWAKVEKTANCWNWQGTLDSKGYGVVIRDHKRLRAHRYVFEIAGTPVPDGLSVDHICHNTRCVRPAHLRTVTQKQNTEHRLGANRQSRTGIRGVSWHKHSGLWQARLTHHGKHICVGYFKDIDDAEMAVTAVRKQLFTHNDADRVEASA